MAKKKKGKRRLLFRDGLFSATLSLFTCYILSLLFLNTSFFNPLTKALRDFSFLDVYYAERLDKDHTVDPNIVLVNVEHNDRKALALALQEVLQAKPKVVGFDIILKEFERKAADTLLKELLIEKNIVATYVIDNDGSKTINHSFFGPSSLGFANFNFDFENAVVREFIGIHKKDSNQEEAFSIKVAKRYLPKAIWKKKGIDKEVTSSRVINYKGNFDRFMSFTIDELKTLKDKTIFNDKIVLFGYLGTPTNNLNDVEDKHFTPLNESTSGKSIPDMYGLVIHANIISMIISDDFMYKVSGFWSLVFMFLCSFLASTYFIWLDKRLKISYRTVRKTVLFVFAILLVWITLILFKNGMVLKAAPIIFVTFFSAGFVKYYKHLVKYINTKRKFKSYLK